MFRLFPSYAVKVAIVLAAICPLPALATDGPGGSGGGSGVNAEITRATDAFIDIVRANPDQFPGITPEALINTDAQILVTTQEIKTCDGIGTLEAFSDSNKSVFNLDSWASKQESIDKVFLAGHERLVMKKFEKSNQYTFSNRIYKLHTDQVLKRLKLVDPCKDSPTVCSSIKETSGLINETLANFKSGKITRADADLTLNMIGNSVISIGLMAQVEAYYHHRSEEAAQLAVDQALKPQLISAKQMIEVSVPDASYSCIDLK